MNEDIEVKYLENEILKDKILTAIKKRDFINEIKYGLGDKIKENPRQVKVYKKNLLKRIKETITDFFTIF